MTKEVYRGSQSLLEVIDEVPPIPVDPPQGFQAELGLVYLYNPNAANNLIKELNSTIGEVNDAIADVTQLTVDALKIKPYSLLGEPIAQYTPCEFDGCIYIAVQTIDTKPSTFDPSQWTKAGTADYNKLSNKPSFITREDLSCTATGLTYDDETGVLSLTTGYVIPTVEKITSIDSNIATNAANIAQETQQRISAINTANSRIDGLSAGLDAERIDRAAADSQMSGVISNVNGRLTAHESNYNNPHQVTKAQVGLGNVNNTADLDKPISTLTQQALDDLSGRITAAVADLSNYRTSAAQDLIDAQIRVEIGNVAQDVTLEEAARISADAVLGGRVTAIEEVIPSTASTNNLLADRAFVNSSINNMAAYYITASASGNAFGNHARLVSGPWYFQGQLRTPTMNDYALVIEDETHDNHSARYLFDGVQWAFQYTLNDTEFTQAQIDAINSTITQVKVILYDAHLANKNNPHEVTAEQVGLGNVDNTSDLNKPISTATQTALDLKADKSTTYTKTETGTLLSGKQDTISDLATIRSNATAGKDASDTIATYGNIVTHNVSEFATAAQGAKADTAVQPGDLSEVATSGSYNDLIDKPTIPTVNNATLTIQKNGITVQTFTANQNTDATADISVPTKISDLTDDSNFANTDLSNLTSTGKNIGLWCNNAANIIAEIPQDIKLEVSGDTITLKSGSKTYVPNGSGVFDPCAYTQDKSVTMGADISGTFIVFAGATADSDIYAQRDNCFYSGANPTISTSVAIWYDTTENKVKFSANSGSTWSGTYSFPVAKLKVSSGTITSVEQVFNGFGYIGSTIFALPGIKYLMPNGRNEDGTLKNTEYTKTSVGVVTNINASMPKVLMLSDNGSLFDGKIWFDSKTKPNFLENYNNYWYNPDTNKVYYYRNSSTQYYISCALVGWFITDSSAKIDTLNTKCAFQSMDYNDTGFIAHQSMPSDKYVDLILPADSGSIIAPADGYVFLDKKSSAANQRVFLINDTGGKVRSVCISSASGQDLAVFVPCSKGDRVRTQYDAGGTTSHFKFVYANGSK